MCLRQVLIETCIWNINKQLDQVGWLLYSANAENGMITIVQSQVDIQDRILPKCGCNKPQHNWSTSHLEQCRHISTCQDRPKQYSIFLYITYFGNKNKSQKVLDTLALLLPCRQLSIVITIVWLRMAHSLVEYVFWSYWVINMSHSIINFFILFVCHIMAWYITR